ncbi:hypothetical protein FHT12_000219 [Xanthomonas campestris]|nr:hypothetical protein [Xanthomonas euroxanthea]SYZ55731.1 hypothetical protein CPBF367_29180 [Xanthomonas arboricola pv. juglandis]
MHMHPGPTWKIVSRPWIDATAHFDSDAKLR